MNKYKLLFLSLIVACMAVLCLPATALAADAAATDGDATPLWLSPGFYSALIALATGMIAIWQNAAKKTAQKVSETLVLAIEEASKIPAVADKEKEIKKKIQEVNERYHIEPVVKKLVEKLT
jgi:ABC-type nickel/cobalt efflux system permease component RcnA